MVRLNGQDAGRVSQVRLVGDEGRCALQSERMRGVMARAQSLPDLLAMLFG